MEMSSNIARLVSGVCLLALAACGGGGGGTTLTPPTTNNPSPGPVNIGAPNAATSGGSTLSFNLTNSLPPAGTLLPLRGPVVLASPSAVSFPAINDATATFRGTVVSGGITYPVFDLNIPSLSVSAANVRGDGTSVTLSNGGQVSAAVAGLNYLLLGAWSYTPPGNSGGYVGQTVTGSLSPASGVPSSGTATYTGGGNAGGTVGAFSVPSGSGTIQAGSLTGNVSLNVNFGSNTVTGTLSGMNANTTANGSGTTPWNNVSLNGNLSRSSTVSMAGATSTAGAPAGAGTPGFSGAATGTFSAQFYGPSGQEVGGSWTLYESTPAGGKAAVGTFAAR